LERADDFVAAFQMLMNVAVLSYSAATLAFLLLGALLLTKWKRQLHGVALAVACLLTAFWSGELAWEFAWTTHLSLVANLLEVLRNLGWTVFLLLIALSQQGKRSSDFKLGSSFAAIGLFYLAILFATLSGGATYSTPIAGILFSIIAIGRVGSAVLGLFLVEQLYRNTRVEQRWNIKFACLGIGVLFVYDFYMYSDAMLFRHINAEIWAARGVVNALTVPLIAISASRNPKWSSGIAVSRQILFHSAALLGAAIYLLAMASAGYYLRFFGGSWGAVMQVAFLFGAGIVLAGVLFSGVFRSWLRVFISKHFYNYNYDYREEWLRFTRTLSEDGPNLGERVVQALAKLVESPAGAVFMCEDPARLEPFAQWNMSLNCDSDPANFSICQFLEQKQWVIDMQEYAADPSRYASVAIPAWLRALPRVWLVVPLSLHGKLVGFVVLAKARSELKLNWEVIDLLKIAGSQAASYLAQHESATALMVARQFESFNRMSTFVVHDLKNLVSQLSLMISNAERHKDNPEFQQDMIETVDFSVKKMKLLLQKLSRKDSIERFAPLVIDELVQQAVKSKSSTEPIPQIRIHDAGLTVLADWERLERVIGHIIQNAIEATPKDGKVVISVAKAGDNVVVSVDDNGQGMSEEFVRERLFKPFETTKSAGMGIGVFESREYIQELGGQLTVVSRESIGTTFRMMLPLDKHSVQLLQEEVDGSN